MHIILHTFLIHCFQTYPIETLSLTSRTMGIFPENEWGWFRKAHSWVMSLLASLKGQGHHTTSAYQPCRYCSCDIWNLIVCILSVEIVLHWPFHLHLENLWDCLVLHSKSSVHSRLECSLSGYTQLRVTRFAQCHCINKEKCCYTAGDESIGLLLSIKAKWLKKTAMICVEKTF